MHPGGQADVGHLVSRESQLHGESPCQLGHSSRVTGGVGIAPVNDIGQRLHCFPAQRLQAGVQAPIDHRDGNQQKQKSQRLHLHYQDGKEAQEEKARVFPHSLDPEAREDLPKTGLFVQGHGHANQQPLHQQYGQYGDHGGPGYSDRVEPDRDRSTQRAIRPLRA